VRLKEIREGKLMSQKELAQKLRVASSTLSQWEAGKRQPDYETIIKLADYFNVSVDYLLGRTDSPDIIVEPTNMYAKALFEATMPKSAVYKDNIPTRSVPLVGRIACGEPILAEQHIERYIDVIDSVKADFALTCVGDSMTGARIYDGDVVFVKQQPTVENGEIAAVLIDDEATLKRVYFYPSRDCLVLKAENPKFDDLIFYGEEINSVRILGKAIYFVSMVRD